MINQNRFHNSLTHTHTDHSDSIYKKTNKKKVKPNGKYIGYMRFSLVRSVRKKEKEMKEKRRLEKELLFMIIIYFSSYFFTFRSKV